MDTWGRKLELTVRQRSRRLPVNYHGIGLFLMLPARRGLIYAATTAFWHDLESPHWFLVSTLLCFSYFMGLLPTVITSLTSLLRRLTMLVFVVLTIRAFFRTVSYGIVLRYGSARM